MTKDEALKIKRFLDWHDRVAPDDSWNQFMYHELRREILNDVWVKLYNKKLFK